MTKAKGNMYEFLSHTWNPVKGKCSHNCSYCYMKDIRERFSQTEREPYISDYEMKSNLGKGNKIFIGSSCDLFAENIPDEWILRILFAIERYPENTYLFQTKNPQRYLNYFHAIIGGKVETEFPKKCILGTTIETNRIYPCMGNTPSPNGRAKAIELITSQFNDCFITIEPILDFDFELFVPMLKDAMPKYINVGADSGNNHLPEPEPEKIRELIKELEKFTEVRLKKNLKRLLPEIN